MANGAAGFTLGIVGAIERAVYALQRLALNDQERSNIIGPVLFRLANGLNINRAIGAAANPCWLRL